MNDAELDVFPSDVVDIDFPVGVIGIGEDGTQRVEISVWAE